LERRADKEVRTEVLRDFVDGEEEEAGVVTVDEGGSEGGLLEEEIEDMVEREKGTRSRHYTTVNRLRLTQLVDCDAVGHQPSCLCRVLTWYSSWSFASQSSVDSGT
jgi:hypothetical protein